jgi:hypothetical protein
MSGAMRASPVSILSLRAPELDKQLELGNLAFR